MPASTAEPGTAERRLQVLLVEPWLGGSHRAWAEGYARSSTHDVVVVGHEGRHWRWRMQGAALSLAAEIDDVVARRGRPDVLLVSDMVNLPALLGLARRAVGSTPVALYLHENQLTYPPAPGQPVDAWPGLANWLSMAAADVVLLNSAFHRDELLAALPGLLRRAPDHGHLPWLEEVAARCRVLPVGVDLSRLDRSPVRRRRDDGPPVVLWNHRWEHDKRPERFAAGVHRLLDDGIELRVVLAGEVPPRRPEVFDGLVRRLGAAVVHLGWAPEPRYVELLGRADVVVSTADHEFFGVAVVEAIAAGAFPVLPRRLSYPELLPAHAHRSCLYDDEEGLVSRLRWAVESRQEAAAVADDLRRAMSRFDWSVLAPAYDDVLASLAR